MWGCAPSITVTQAGNPRQFEITVNSNEFSFKNTEDLVNAWHQKARETCYGNDYKVISRDIVKSEDPFNNFFITGIIECQ